MMSIDPTPDAEPDETLASTVRPIKAVGEGMTVIVRQFLALLGLVLIAVAIPIGIVTPLVPIGLPLGIVGVILLGRNAVWGRRWMERVLVRHPRIEKMAPNWVMKLVFGRNKYEPPRIS
jgi:hypothetical protein